MAAGKPTDLTFSTPVIVNDNVLNEQESPVIVAMPGNELFIAWQDSRLGNEDIFVPKSHANETSFNPNKKADDATGTSKQIEPAAVVTINGTILLTWQDNRRTVFDYDIYFTKSYDSGATFSKNVKVDDSNTSSISWQERPAIAVTTSGAIFIGWTDDRSGQLRVRGAYSLDGGATFAASKEIAPSSSSHGQTSITLASSGNRIFAAFLDNTTATNVPHPYVCISNDGGKTFSAPSRLDNSDVGRQMSLVIAPMPEGGVVAVWGDSRNGNQDIYAAITSSNGSVATPDFRVDDDTTGAYQVDPAVATDKLGNIYVTWQDERDLLFAVRFAYKLSGKAQFNASVEIATPGVNDMQRRACVVAAYPGKACVAWEDDKAGTYDVYTASTTIPISFTLNLGTGWNFVSLPLVGSNYKASTLGLSSGDYVARWDSTSRSYQNYIVGVPVNDFVIEPSVGYWINVPSGTRSIVLYGSAPTTVQTRTMTVPLGGGWVTVGFAVTDTIRHAKDVPSMFSQPGQVKTVASYVRATNSYTNWVSAMPDTNNFALVPGLAYWINLGAGGVLTYSPEATPKLLNLVSGWNLMSVPLSVSGCKASTLGLMPGDTVAQWNSATKSYQNHVVGIPVNDFNIMPSVGYWVNVPSGTRTLAIYGSVPSSTQSRTITVPSGGGWAMTGFVGLNSTRHASDIQTMYRGGNVTTVSTWNPVTKAYTSWLSVIPSVNNFVLVPGQAYWILCSASGTITYIP
jgi:hypothetical protein